MAILFGKRGRDLRTGGVKLTIPAGDFARIEEAVHVAICAAHASPGPESPEEHRLVEALDAALRAYLACKSPGYWHERVQEAESRYPCDS